MTRFFLGVSAVGLIAVGAVGFFQDLNYWGWWVVGGLAVLASTHDSI